MNLFSQTVIRFLIITVVLFRVLFFNFHFVVDVFLFIFILLWDIKLLFKSSIFILTIFSYTVFTKFSIKSESMCPYLKTGDKVISLKASIKPYFFKFYNGDVILFNNPPNDKKNYIKRLFAQSGDTLIFEHENYSLDNKNVLSYDEDLWFLDIEIKEEIINKKNVIVPKKGMKMNMSGDNYQIYKHVIEFHEGNSIKKHPDGYYINGKLAKTYTFKKDYCFVMGDNRANSIDSRHWGFLPMDAIIGKALFVLPRFDFWN